LLGKPTISYPVNILLTEHGAPESDSFLLDVSVCPSFRPASRREKLFSLCADFLENENGDFYHYQLGKLRFDQNLKIRGRDSSVGIATRYGLDGPGSNPGGVENFRTCPDQL
jgi:hypothetical protein